MFVDYSMAPAGCIKTSGRSGAAGVIQPPGARGPAGRSALAVAQCCFPRLPTLGVTLAHVFQLHPAHLNALHAWSASFGASRRVRWRTHVVSSKTT